MLEINNYSCLYNLKSIIYLVILIIVCILQMPISV